MDIPNLNQSEFTPSVSQNRSPYLIIVFVVIVALVSGFWLSRLFPLNNNGAFSNKISDKTTATNSSQIKLQVGKLYGSDDKAFTDSAVGTLEKGSINGEGTHILVREGGLSQRASLTSSIVDLDLFIGKKIEVKGQTNSSKKTSWLMDVGSVKILE